MAEQVNVEALVTSTTTSLPSTLSTSLSTPPSLLSTRPPHRRHRSEFAPWHFPGPSSRFNSKLEKNYADLSLASQRDYTPISPVLNTAARAQHRRVRSSANVPTLRANALLSPASTATTPAPTRIPTRSPLRRLSTAHSSTASEMPPSAAPYGPVTPSHRAYLSSRPSSKLQDSPFSDYFTDDGRSPESNSTSAPSPEMQALLIRLNRLPSQLIRGERDNENEMVAMVGRKIAEMEAQLDNVHAQTRQPVELEDSGLFMEEDADAEEEEGSASVTSRHDTPTHDDVFNPPVTDEHRKAEHDFLLLEAQRILGSVRKAEENLRKRHAELRELNEKYILEVEEINTQLTALENEREDSVSTNEGLRSDNVALKRDMAVSGHELLWLKMQFQALKLEVRAGDAGAERLERYAPQLKDDIQAVKRERLARRWKAWEEDWQDVERKMGRRRRRYDSFTAAAEKDGIVGGAEDDSAQDEDNGDWKVDHVTEQDGKMQRIVLTRVSSDNGDESTGQADHNPDPLEEEDEDVPNSKEDSSIASTPTLSLVIDLSTIETAPDSSPLPPTTYEDSATQTDTSRPVSTSTSSWILAKDEDESERIEDECAITTSPPSEVGVDEFSEDEEEAVAQHETALRSSGMRTAWQELWTGLTHLAGMDEAD